MISIELWRARIGGWRGGAKSTTGLTNSPHQIFNQLVLNKEVYNVLLCCMAATLIGILLIIGGVELNPGPPKKASNSSSDDETVITCPQGEFVLFYFSVSSFIKIIQSTPLNWNTSVSKFCPD